MEHCCAFQAITPLRLSCSRMYRNNEQLTCYRRRQPQPCMVATAPVVLKDRKVTRVDPKTGWAVSGDKVGEEVVTGTMNLAPEYVSSLDVRTERTATARVYAKPSVLSSPVGARAIVFLHGFSQRPANYASTLRLLAAHGYVVLAPRTWLFDVAWPWVTIEAAGESPDAAAKLQTALLIDALRCVSAARADFGASNVALLGHSMGGAMALVAARALGTVSSVATLAPAVGPTALTPVNEFLSYKRGGDVSKFTKSFGNTPLLISHGADDAIVPKDDMDTLFGAFQLAEQPLIAAFCNFFEGRHIGYEDSLEVDVPLLNFLDVIFFRLVDLFVFGLLDVIFDARDQRMFNKKLLLRWFDATTVTGIDIDALRAAINDIDPDHKAANITWRA